MFDSSQSFPVNNIDILGINEVIEEVSNVYQRSPIPVLDGTQVEHTPE